MITRLFLVCLFFCGCGVQNKATKHTVYGHGGDGIYQYRSFWKKPIILNHSVIVGDGIVMDTCGYIRFANGIVYRLRPQERITNTGQIHKRTWFEIEEHGKLQEYSWDKGVHTVAEDVLLSNGDTLSTNGILKSRSGHSLKLVLGERITSDGERRNSQ